MRRMRGITLLEVAIALTIGFLLFGFAVPALHHALARTRIGHARLALADSFLHANRVAVATGSATVICPAPNGDACRASTDWSAGWLVFADVDGDRRYGPSDTLIQRRHALGGDIRLLSTAGRTRIVFQPEGDSAGSNLTFTLCSPRAGEAGLLVLSNPGRVRLDAASAAQTAACRYGPRLAGG